MKVLELFKKKKARVVDFDNPDYVLGGGWGCHVSLLDDEETYTKTDLNKKHRIGVYGHYTPRPKIGQTLMIEGGKTWTMFEFLDVEYCNDPNDMFFGKVKAIGQKLKGEI